MTTNEDGIVPFWCSNYTGNTTIYLKEYYCSRVEINMTSCKLVQTESEMDSIRILCETSEIVWFSVFWFSVVFGLVGNSLAFITVASLPVSIATFYVGLLAVSDFVAILLRMIIYFLNKKNLLNPTTPYWHIFPLLFDFSMSYSNWLLVLICVDRFISIRYPLKRRFYFTLRHARIASFTMGAILFAIYFVAVQTIGYIDTKMFTVRNLLYSVIPLIFILVLIVLIAVQFRIIRKKRKFLSESNTTQSSSSVTTTTTTVTPTSNQSNNSPHKNRAVSSRRQSDRSVPSHDSVTPLRGGSCVRTNSQTTNHQNNNHQNQQNNHNPNHNHNYHRRTNVFEDIERLENNITIMMLITAIFFAILTIPNCVLLFTYRHADRLWNTPIARARWNIFSKTSQVLTFLNLCINFFLYFLSAKKFRHQLCHLLRCRRKGSPCNSSHVHHNTEVVNTHNEQSETFL